MGVKYLTDQGPDGARLGSTVADTVDVYAAVTVQTAGYINFASGGLLKIGGTTVLPTAATMNLMMAGVTAGQKIARGASSVTTSLEVITGLATVVAGVASLRDDPNISAYWATCAASTTAGNILLKTWMPTATNNVAVAAATKTSVLVDWIAVGT